METQKMETQTKCDACGELGVVGTRHAKHVDGGTDLKVCQDCLDDPFWDTGEEAN